MRGLRKVSKPKVGGRRFKASKDEQALQETRSRPCLLRGKRCTITVWRYAGDAVNGSPYKSPVAQEYQHVCDSPAEAHHVTTKARGGHDGQTVPLCRAAHAELHGIGQKAFEERWDVSLSVEQAKVWAAYKARKESA
jgi:hypothetical protein